jgi:hypothetical protein
MSSPLSRGIIHVPDPMHVEEAPDDVTPPDDAIRVFTVLRTDHPRGCPESGRERPVAFYRWRWMALLHLWLLSRWLRHGPRPYGLLAVSLALGESHLWAEDEES